MDKSFAIEMKNIAFGYGSKKVLQNFHLQIEEQKTYCLIGSSGSGKTTALRLMNGLLKPQSGSVRLFGEEFDFAQAEKIRRSMGYSIQGSGLFPHMNLAENLGIIAKKQGWSQKQIRSRIEELCELMSLPSDRSFLQKKPRQISGGQQQRIGIARALFMKPKILLMDEPFSALDPITRSELQKEFLRLQAKLKLTIVLVTHDLSEAFSMANDIVLLHAGQIEQKGRPSKFLLNPATEHVESFIRSHSPGNLLKEVYLYSVINTNFFGCCQKQDNIQVVDMDSGQTKKFQNQEDVQNFLGENQQSSYYWMNEKGEFLKTESFDGLTDSQSLASTSNILDGMKALLKSKTSAIPVVNSDKKLIGVFSEEALRAL